MSTELTKQEPKELAVPQSMLEVVMRATADPAIDPARLREFLAIGKELEAEKAKREFTTAFLAAKEQLKDIRIEKNGRIVYDKPGKQGGVVKFMQYEDIARTVQPILAEHGLAASFSYEYIQTPPKIICVMTLRHRGGHTEEFRSVPLPMIDSSGGKNDIQGAGSVGTYGRRYVICPAFDIVAEGEDDDASGKGQAEPITEAQQQQIVDIVQECENKEPGFANRFKKWLVTEFRAEGLHQIHQGAQVKAVLAKLSDKMKALGI